MLAPFSFPSSSCLCHHPGRPINKGIDDETPIYFAVFLLTEPLLVLREF